MTRDQAIKTIKSGIEVVTPKTAGELVDVLEKLGLLTLEQPTPPRDKFIRELQADGKSVNEILDCLDRAGLKIVEK